MIADKFINFIIWIFQNLILKNWPVDFPWSRFSDYQISLNQARDFLITAFSGISGFFPVFIFFGFLIAMISAEVSLFGFKGIKWIINLFRGSGT